MHRKDAYSADPITRLEFMGWSLVVGLLPIGAGLALFENGHFVLGTIFAIYGLLLAWLGMRLSAEM